MSEGSEAYTQTLVDKGNIGGGQLVDARGVSRIVGDTKSSGVYVTDLPKNFIGGEEALHFALGELFGQYGKIKKIELYMDKGILDTENFKGDALVVYHPSKHTGSREKEDPVYTACTELDGKFRILGKRYWRIKAEAAEWQKEGYDAKAKKKLHPCVEITNLWDYHPDNPLSFYMEMQKGILAHAASVGTGAFVKVEPNQGSALVWFKGAQDTLKFASQMHKSYFLGRKVQATLCRKERPTEEKRLNLPTLSELTMQAQDPDVKAKWDAHVAAAQARADAAGQPVAESAEPAAPEEAPVISGPAFVLRKGCKIVIKGLVAKAENNGKTGRVLEFLSDLGKYQVELDGRSVKLKPENIEAAPPPPARGKKRALTREDDLKLLMRAGAEPTEEEAEAELEAAMAAQADGKGQVDSDAEGDNAMDVAKAHSAAADMAAGNVRHGPEPIGVDALVPTVCVDPALLPKRGNAEEDEPIRKRESSRSRERRMQERVDAAKARLEAAGGSRPKWVMAAPDEAAALAAGAARTAPAAVVRREPEESREELLKLPVAKLKALLVEFGKTARGCLEKKDFVDRLKPAPKA